MTELAKQVDTVSFPRSEGQAWWISVLDLGAIEIMVPEVGARRAKARQSNNHFISMP